jgi:WD40 repeat protein
VSGSWTGAADLALTYLSPHLRSVFDLELGTLMRTVKGHSDWVRSVCVTRSEVIISGSDDRTMR